MKLTDALNHHTRYPFHMPGHKRNIKQMGNLFPYDIDITEIYGFDNLHHTEGILQELMNDTANVFGAKHSFLMVNGSSGGLLSAIRACTKPQDTVILARGCHKAVYHAIELCQLRPVYITAPLLEHTQIQCSISPDDVQTALQQHSDCALVILTSPTYEGIVSDIATIADIVHQYHIPLLIDEAHGAHLGFSNHFPKSSIQLGADIVIQSLHKTLPAPTQTAVLHVCSSRVPLENIRRQLSVFQTSSPSYVFLSAMERCISLLQRQKENLFAQYHENLCMFYESTNTLQHLEVLQPKSYTNVFDYDYGKILIATKTISGTILAERLRNQYDIELELSQPQYALAMTSICDTLQGFFMLSSALQEIDKTISSPQHQTITCDIPPLPPICYTSSEVFSMQTKIIPLSESVGKLSADYIWAYPPGIPFLVPGERMTKELFTYITQLQQYISIESAYAQNGYIQIIHEI